MDSAEVTRFRNQSRRHLELLIWVLLLLDHHRVHRKGLTGKHATNVAYLFTRFQAHFPKGIATYFLHRFIDPETARPFIEGGKLYDPAAKRVRDLSVNRLGDHMLKISRALQDLGFDRAISTTTANRVLAGKK